MKNLVFLVALHLAFCTFLFAQWLEATITVGNYPRALVYNSRDNKVYCANTQSNTLTVIDKYNSVIKTIPVGGQPRVLVYNFTNNKIYCVEGSNNVRVINGTTDSVIKIVTVGERPSALVYNPTNNKVYCANEYSGDVTVIDCETNTVITTIPLENVLGH